MKLRLRKELNKKEKWRFVMSYFREHPHLMMEVMPAAQLGKDPLFEGRYMESKAKQEVKGEYYVGGATKNKAAGSVYEHYLKL